MFYCNLLPLLGSLLAVGLAIYYPPHLGEWMSLAVMWFLIGIGVTVGYHRYFTHQAFETGPFVRVILAILGSMSALGPLVAWVSTHRRHHQLSDREGDPHSPNLNGPGFHGRLKGIWYAHFGWMLSHPMPNPVRYARDILRDSRLKWVNRMYYYSGPAGSFAARNRPWLRSERLVRIRIRVPLGRLPANLLNVAVCREHQFSLSFNRFPAFPNTRT